MAAANDTLTNEVDAQGEELMTETRFDPAAHAKAMRTGGFWIDKSYDEFLQLNVARAPDKLALLAYR